MISLFAKRIIEIGRRLYARGMIAGSDGNISARMSANEIIITPSGKCKGLLKEKDLVVIDLEGFQLRGHFRASSEAAMHTHLYRNRSDIAACVHAHPPYATAFSVIGESLTEPILPEVILFVGDIPIAPYAPPGTDAVGKSLDEFLTNHNAFLLKNHGLVTVGRNLEEAYNRLETVEYYARILFIARQIGSANKLESMEVERLKRLAEQLKSTPLPLGP